jgi:hypothetical protein
MTSTNTKGPFKVEHHDGRIEIWNQDTKIAIINEAHEDPDMGPENLANAALLAASLDLFRALQAMIPVYQALLNDSGAKADSVLLNARKAIAKAKG